MRAIIRSQNYMTMTNGSPGKQGAASCPGSGGRGPPPTRGRRQGLRLPDLAWKLKSLEQFIETPE